MMGEAQRKNDVSVPIHDIAEFDVVGRSVPL